MLFAGRLALVRCTELFSPPTVATAAAGFVATTAACVAVLRGVLRPTARTAPIVLILVNNDEDAVAAAGVEAELPVVVLGATRVLATLPLVGVV